MRTYISRVRWGWAVAVLSLLVGTYRPASQATSLQAIEPSNLGPKLERGEQTLYGVLGPMGDWPSVEIMLNNNGATEMVVTPTMYRDGRDTVGDVVVLQPKETRWIPIRELFPQAPPRRREIDALELRFFGYLLDLRTQIVARRARALGSVDVLFTGRGEFRTRTLNAVWVAPAGGRAVLTLGNTSDDEIVATVSGRGRSQDVRLSPHETITLLRPGLPHAPSADFLRVTSHGPLGALRAGGFVEFGPRTFGLIRFFDPGIARQANLAASNLRTSQADVQMALFNTSDVAVTAQPEARAATRTATSPILLPRVVIPPRQAVIVDTSALRRLPVSRASIRVVNSGAAGSLVGYLASIDRRTLAAYELPLREGGPMRQSTGNYPWRLDGDYSSIASIVNVGETTAAFSVVLTYDGGFYRARPETLAPGATATFDVAEIRASQVPGLDGAALPAHVDRGQFKWSIAGPVGDGRLNGRMEIVSQRTGQTSSYSCGQCCPESYDYGIMQPAPVGTATGGATQFTILNQLKTCSGSQGGQTYAYVDSWSVAEPWVASFSATGLGTADANGLSVGDSAFNGSWTAFQYVPYYEDCNEVWVDGSDNSEVDVQCAVPTNFRMVGTGQDVGLGTLKFVYTWDFSTGDKSHLAQCDVGESVSYNSADIPFPSPPFNAGNAPANPTELGGKGDASGLIDFHSTVQPFVRPYSLKIVNASQIYRYRCPCANSGNWVTIDGPINISRTVYQSGGGWKFAVSKSGWSAYLDLP